MACEKCNAEIENKVMRALVAMLDNARAADAEDPPTDEENSALSLAQAHGFHYYMLLDWLTKDKKPYFLDPVAEVTGPLFSNLPPAAPECGDDDAAVAARKD